MRDASGLDQEGDAEEGMDASQSQDLLTDWIESIREKEKPR